MQVLRNGQWVEDDYGDMGSEAPPPVQFAGEEYNEPLIAGYGDRMSILRPGQEAVNEWGAPVSQEYVKDIESTFGLSESEVAQKIASQRPPRPSDQELNVFDEWQKFLPIAMKDIKINPKEEGEKAKQQRLRGYYSNMNVADQALLTPMQKQKIQWEAEKVGQDVQERAQTQLDRELTLVRSLFEKQLATRIEQQKNARELAEKRAEFKPGQNWILPDRTTVISYDEGKSYVASDGKMKQMPSSAIKVPGGATLGELNMNEAKKQAAAELGTGATGIGKSPKGAALEGTGPYNRLGSAFEAVAGGLGMDILVGQQGFFPDMADAKQYLRSVKQMGKAALMNSARGAIWEQQRIDELFPDPDKTFTNPRIEARKFGNLLSILSQEKMFNNQAIIESLTPKEVEKYRTSNNEIDRLLSLISEPSVGISTQDRALVDKYLKRMKR